MFLKRRRFFLRLSGEIFPEDLRSNSEDFVSLLDLEFDITDFAGTHRDRSNRFRNKGFGYNLLEIEVFLKYNDEIIKLSGIYGENGGTKTGKAVTTNEDEDDDPIIKD